MAAPDSKPHQPRIRTPRQLAVVLVLAFAIPIIVVGLLASLATTGMKVGAGSERSEAVEERIKPVARVNIAEAAAEAKGEKTGEQVVQSSCAACHQTGAAGAPKIGDRAAWTARIARGEKALLEAAIKGVRAMPPRGGNPDLTDAEVERALVFMANQSGANFKEPSAAAAKAATR